MCGVMIGIYVIGIYIYIYISHGITCIGLYVYCICTRFNIYLL